MTFSREQLAEQATNLAAQGVFIGTSSWKYPGWFRMICDRGRYEYRGKFAQTLFNWGCLAEYAEVLKTVCVDAAYYNFPSQQYLEGVVSARLSVGFILGPGTIGYLRFFKSEEKRFAAARL